MPRQWTPDDAGCYVDGARGIYAGEMIQEIARDEGRKDEILCCNGVLSDSECQCPSHRDPEAYYWATEEAEEYLNEHCAPKDHYFGNSEQGDWGLWPVEEGN